MMMDKVSLLLGLTCVAVAIQPGAVPAQPAQLRNLEFGDINFLHTTDTHGWHAGHLLEASYSADWGDYISFTEHLRSNLEAQGKDLIVIDTGDRIEGNGLYDSSIPRGKYTFPIFESQHIDLLCVGNHELYKNTSATDDYTQLVPKYGSNYLASNLDIYDNANLTAFADRYKVFTTKNGIRVAAFGFIFDFTRNDKNTVITPVERVVYQKWFQDAIREHVDLFIVIGHVALRQTEMEVLYETIRAANPDTPIHFFGGHFHIRDYRVFDDRAHALASGRFMETIGFSSITNLSDPTFSRRYIDNNLYSLQHHSNTTSDTFATKKGLKVSQAITNARTALELDQTFGCAPKTYWMSRVPRTHPDSIFSLLVNEIFPSIKRNTPSLILTNTGAIRFDIFAGPFTRDSTFIVSPFTSNLSYIADVPYALAKRLLPILNQGGPQTDTIDHSPTQTTVNLANVFHQGRRYALADLPPPEQQNRNYARSKYPLSLDERSNVRRQYARESILAHSPLNPRFTTDLAAPYHQTSSRTQGQIVLDTPLRPGYTTIDDLGDDGDDTLHAPIEYFDVPNVIQADFGGAEKIDLVFNQFLMPYVIQILNFLPYESVEGGSEMYEWVAEYERFMEEARQCGEKGLVGCSGNEHGLGVAMGERYEEYKTVLSSVEQRVYSEKDVENYVPGETFTSILAKWVGQNWKENCGEHYEL